ncbi:MAG TPA: hypothetical protein PK214_14040, partial [Ottowia sp.]|nr:hypothetical protein [Ottowia sp.]
MLSRLPGSQNVHDETPPQRPLDVRRQLSFLIVVDRPPAAPSGSWRHVVELAQGAVNHRAGFDRP